MAQNRVEYPWNVPKVTWVLVFPIAFKYRSFISFAAARVNVTTRIREAEMPLVTSWQVRPVITAVFPDPGPARTIMGPVVCITAFSVNYYISFG